MKKYKLIKTYPGSPLLGKVLEPKVEKDNENTNNFFWEGSWFNPNDFPEFWEEMNYEILSYIKKGSTTCTTTKRRGGENHEKLWNIHSVKRLSDGEVFTVGDRIAVSEIGISDTITEIVLAESVRWPSPVVTKQIFLGCKNDYQYILSSVNKVIEKDYEILKTCPIEGAIYSVKRLSDGEVFTVGDKVSREGGYFESTILSINDKFEAKTTLPDCVGMNWLKKVKQLDYEILSYWSERFGDTKYLYYEGHEDWDNINKSKYHPIHSVKRLSDGEVFTLGDTIKVSQYGNPHIIGKFSLTQK
jgi:hypothetical protein